MMCSLNSVLQRWISRVGAITCLFGYRVLCLVQIAAEEGATPVQPGGGEYTTELFDTEG